MFVGYQNDKIVFVANTQEELEKLSYVTLDKIEETDKTYFLHNGEYVCEVPLDQQIEEVRQTRENLYTTQVDRLTAQIQRLRDEEQTEEVIAEIEALKVKRSAIVEKIKSENPYPETAEEVNNLQGDTQNETNSEENSTNSYAETTDLMV